MSEEGVNNEVSDAAAANVEAKEKGEAQDAAISNRAQSADDDEADGDDQDQVSDDASSEEGQSAGETTDSATPQSAGEEAGSEGEGSASTPTGSAASDVAVPAAPPSPEPASSAALPEVSAHSSAVGEDEKTAPLGESDNDDDEDTANASTKNKKSPIKKKSSSRYEPPPPFVDDPSKVTLRFIFPNKDGLTVTVDCQPTDTVGEVKGMLLSMWPDELPPCSGGNRLRLICMGKGILSPDTKSIQDCSVPVFHTHATPINVAVTPEHIVIGGGAAASKVSKGSRAGVAGAGVGGSGSGGSGSRNSTTATASAGCGCVIQ